ncbi:MAG: hypothetical protein IT165_13620 [Bryobacterales bacterium]|nr:hypothetical protein [Bryobacterales bacterium]
MTDTVTVSGEGRQIVIDFPSLGEALSLWKPWGDGKRRAEIVEALHETLAAAGLSLELRVQGKPVALLGGEEMSGLALRLLCHALR